VKGFLSLDCGAPAPYTDQKGISWVPDDAYISDGKTASVASLGGADPFFYSFIKDLRYFPDSTRTRYCYSLPTIVGQNYLIRATFFHGGYDNSPVVKFDTAVDVFDTRRTFSFNVQNGYGFGEYIFQAFKDNVQFCLYRLSPTGNPFISSLELRPVDNSMYAAVAGGSALSHQARVSFGPLIANITRLEHMSPHNTSTIVQIFKFHSFNLFWLKIVLRESESYCYSDCDDKGRGISWQVSI
jgi:hypothetical protein